MSTKQRQRRSMPKVRTGCATCKNRRVKCDEMRPQCQRCTSTGRQCPGYPSEPQSKTTIKMYNIPFRVPGSRADRELLHFYCCEAAGCLSRFSDTTLWTHLVLQWSQHQPVIRSALVTFSSLYQDYLRVGSSSLNISPHHIQLIAKSHKQLSTQLVNRNASMEVALICSVIFYIFECLVGNSQQAIWHLDQGIALFQQCWASQPSSTLSSDAVLAQLKPVFARLDIHASIFSFERVPLLDLVSPTQIAGLEPVVPNRFSNIAEAEHVLVVLQNWMLRHLMTYIEYKPRPRDELPVEIICERLQLKSQFQCFEDTIGRLVSEMPEECHTVSQKEQLKLLEIQALIFHGALLENIMDPWSGSNVPMEALWRFDLALSQISTLVSTSSNEKDSAHPRNRDFTVSTNIIAMLYFICMKTQNTEILGKTMSLLQSSLSSARDGLWDAKTAIVIVKAMLPKDIFCQDESVKAVRLEEVGSGIVDASGGLDEAFKMLQIAEKRC